MLSASISINSTYRSPGDMQVVQSGFVLSYHASCESKNLFLGVWQHRASDRGLYSKVKKNSIGSAFFHRQNLQVAKCDA